MIKNLRKKFLFVTYAAILLVVGIIVGYINLFNYTNTMNKHDTLIEHILNNDGIQNEEGVLSRYTIVIDIIDDEIFVRSGNLSEEDSYDIVNHILSLNENKGTYNNYKFGIKESNNTVIVLSNFERDTDLISSYLWNSICISLGGIAIVYIILYFCSSIILKPFILNEENQKEFITNASHELKTPITIIKANLDVLKIDNIENEWTQSIEEQINRLELLTGNLINLSKVAEANLIIKTDFSITDSIKEELISYEVILKEKSINTKIELNENISFNGNEKQIRDAIKLILDNIVKYSCGNLNIYNKDKEIYFTNSTDLQDGNYDYIFNRFTRISISRNQDINGYGIGLSIVKKILDNHNVSITSYVLNNVFILKIKL